jgi:rubredoxin
MRKMQCRICGHIYNPETGDEGVKAGTAFEDVPPDWRCPVCGADKSKFNPFL